jgi:hypothetical protein
MKYSTDVIKNTKKYLKEIAFEGEATTKELQLFFDNNDFTSNSLFFLKLDKRGKKLNSILKGSDEFIGEIRYNKTFKRRLMHWKRC